MALKCPICFGFFALTLRILITHIRTDHSYNPGFFVYCPLNGCHSSFRKFKSFYRHIVRQHSDVIDAVLNDKTHETENATPNHTVIETSVVDYPREMLEENANLLTEDVEETETGMVRDDDENIESVEEDCGDEGHTDANHVRDFTDKSMAIKYIMNLKEFHKIRESHIEAIISGTDSFVQKTAIVLEKRVHAALVNAGFEPDNIPGLSEIFDDFILPFEGLTTNYERNKYIKEHFYYVEPEEVELGDRFAYMWRRQRRVVDVVSDKFYYIPMSESIKQLMENKRIHKLVMAKHFSSEDPEFLLDITDGTIFKNHPIFSSEICSLKILLYADDIEICNPIGKKAGVHKICVFYYSLVNFPVTLRSRLPLIRLVAVIKRNNLHKYGINKVLERIKADLEHLRDGIKIFDNNSEVVLKGALLGFCGDTLAAHEFAGFKEGVGFAYQKCRDCECTYDDMQSKFYARDFIPRTLDRYDQQCGEIENAHTLGMKRRLSVAYGINRRSTARDFPHYDLTSMVPEDIMHVLFEGTVIYETHLCLSELFKNELCTLHSLNSVIENFPYGYYHRSSKPSKIPEKVFEGDDASSLKQSSSSMMMFLRLLPMFLIAKLNIDSNNIYVKFLSDLSEIVQILLAPVISLTTVQNLKTRIAHHLRKFKEIFPSKNILPKQHYMIHLPDVILKFGPLTRLWNMRFEGKHQYMKQRMAGSCNYKNVEKSLSDRNAMFECALNVGDTHPAFQNDLVLGKLYSIRNTEAAKERLEAFFDIETDGITNISSASWVIIHGQKFIAEQCEIAFSESNGVPEFGLLIDIWVVTRDEHNEEITIFFELKMYETIHFDARVQAYAVATPELAQGHELISMDSLFLPFPLHLYTMQQNMYIPCPCDMNDLVNYKQATV